MLILSPFRGCGIHWNESNNFSSHSCADCMEALFACTLVRLYAADPGMQVVANSCLGCFEHSYDKGGTKNVLAAPPQTSNISACH